tara:strand:- start:6649 stop:7467 length:819 start_codon:yes stop_codon:yes gene_type:complete
VEDIFSIEKKVIVITGGAGSLGASIAEYLVQKGAVLIILGRTSSTLLKHVNKLNKLIPSSSSSYTADVLNEEKLKEIRENILNQYGRIDGLINAAGGNLAEATPNSDQTIFDILPDDLKKVIDLNLMGTVLPSFIFGKIMANQHSGSIINISSMASKQVLTRVLGYSMGKAGVEIFTKWMAMELATKFGEKMRVNAIAPGFFIGKQNKELLLNEDGSYTRRGRKIIKKTPMGRFGYVSDLNGSIQYLLSDASKFVTGTILNVDGGFSSFSGI